MAFINKRKKGFTPRRKFCEFCSEKMAYLDYKNVELLSRYISANGQIKSKANTGACAKHQRKLATAIKRARFMALMPYSIVRVRMQKTA
ncbi:MULTISPECIES: 30S ribosomal protein S18 [unclassified Mycoplasma]|uniref:30S ribosomal protein S18 n=1 Tax=unclassified Mycoplasma TaxID=2683645 RepID=UPI00211CD20F|nr:MULTISPECIES: 30S ribosomal protein S18 [unclassified Mycoplasma]UUM19592.1 30S ribosomal protein S18 [Mycoplasma sp. 1578d]UUM24512.1 30S ribosomal protein S18 [Mycoplasma sp. 3686d]